MITITLSFKILILLAVLAIVIIAYNKIIKKVEALLDEFDLLLKQVNQKFERAEAYFNKKENQKKIKKSIIDILFKSFQKFYNQL
jgi:hypothetical protein